MKSKYRYVLPEIQALLGSKDLFAKAKGEPTRFSYADALLALGGQNPDVVSLDADVSKSMKTTMFAAKYPERSFNFGIAEQNMMAAAAGMATTGLIPFANTYAVFASMRALDQVRNSIHYPRLNVKIAASHSGITPGPDGVTHQAQEDLSIMRVHRRFDRDRAGRPDQHPDGRARRRGLRGAGLPQLHARPGAGALRRELPVPHRQGRGGARRQGRRDRRQPRPRGRRP